MNLFSNATRILLIHFGEYDSSKQMIFFFSYGTLPVETSLFAADIECVFNYQMFTMEEAK